jgi:hypothetical protein
MIVDDMLTGEELLDAALASNDEPELLDAAIFGLLNGSALDCRLSYWLALKLIQIKDYKHPKTALNARKLFGLTQRGAPANLHGAQKVTTVQMAALYELMRRQHGKAVDAEHAVARACGMSNESPTVMMERAGFCAGVFEHLPDDHLVALAGDDLLTNVTRIKGRIRGKQ